MHRLLLIGLSLAFPMFLSAAEKNGYEIMKVNHELIDLDGNTEGEVGNLKSKAEYQKELEGSGKYSGIRFQVHWKIPEANISNFVVKLEARGYDTEKQKETRETLMVTYPKTPSHSTGWAALDIKDDALKRFGKLMAWKITLLQAGKSMAERESFTWGPVKNDEPATAAPPQQTTEAQ